MQGSNGIFNSLRHCIHFALFSDILVTDNSIDGSFHAGEVLVVVLVQGICFGNGCINLCVICILVLQGSNGIFDSLCHCVDISLTRQSFAPNNSVHRRIQCGNRFVGIDSQISGNGCHRCFHSTVICRFCTAENLSVHKRPSVAVVAAIQRGCKSFVFHFILRLFSCRFVLVFNTEVFHCKIAIGYFASLGRRRLLCKGIPKG